MPLTSNERSAQTQLLRTLQNASASDGRRLSSVFLELPPKAEIPDYYEVISRPMALDIVRTNIRRDTYVKGGFSDFLKDIAQIFHNARVYNVKASPIYEDAVELIALAERSLKDMAADGLIESHLAKLPVLGVIPDEEEDEEQEKGQRSAKKPTRARMGSQPLPKRSNSVKKEGRKEEVDVEMDDVQSEATDQSDSDQSQEEVSEEDDERPGKRIRRSTLTSRSSRKSSHKNVKDESDDDDDAPRANEISRRKRGRPPKVETPDESRMKSILRLIRKEHISGRLIYPVFEKVPDPKQYPDYYQTIENPISLANVRKRTKRKEYRTLDEFVSDMKLIFKNAQDYNEPGSEIYEDATFLRQKLEDLVVAERSKPDESFMNIDNIEKISLNSSAAKKLARIGLSSIEHEGKSYESGDWVHLKNPNSPDYDSKTNSGGVQVPIIAQIFRTWQNSDGSRWINVCWYYTPESTVHRADKIWYVDEVVKTGQYRDHSIQEVIGHCYVMFVTRFPRGRAKGYENVKTYVCESRYNEEQKTFNKIKSWKSCVPDETRNRDYEMVLFEKPRPLKRTLSPLLYLLSPEEKQIKEEPENVVIPEVRDQGDENAPPRVGNIIPCPIPSEDVVNPREPTPPPPAPVAPIPAPVNHALTTPTPANGVPASVAAVHQANQLQQQALQAQRNQSTPRAPSTGRQMTPVAPTYSGPVQAHNYNHVYGNVQSPAMYGSPASNHMLAQPVHQQSPMAHQPYQHQQLNQNALPARLTSQGQHLNPTALTVAYPNTSMVPPQSYVPHIPEAIKSSFLTDRDGEIIWFTVPPLDPVKTARPGGILKMSETWLNFRKSKKRARSTTNKNETD